VTAMTMLSQRLSTDFTKPRSYTAAGRGSPLMPSNSRPSNGWTGSITAGFLDLSAISPPAELEANYYANLDKRPVAA